MKALPIAAAALMLVACRNEGAETAPPPPTAGGVTCDANRVQDVIGKPRSAALAEDARRRSGAQTVRYLTPDQVVTMEYRGDRLNLHVDAGGKVVRVGCG